jgi:hypothetical protein
MDSGRPGCNTGLRLDYLAARPFSSTCSKARSCCPAVVLVLVGVAFLVRLVPALILPNGAGYEMQVFRRQLISFGEGKVFIW